MRPWLLEFNPTTMSFSSIPCVGLPNLIVHFYERDFEGGNCIGKYRGHDKRKVQEGMFTYARMCWRWTEARACHKSHGRGTEDAEIGLGKYNIQTLFDELGHFVENLVKCTNSLSNL